MTDEIRDLIVTLRYYNEKDTPSHIAADHLEKLLAVYEAADVLYKQLHNIKEVRPRWANDSVCEAMVEVGKTIAAVQTRREPKKPDDWQLQSSWDRMINPADSRQPQMECPKCPAVYDDFDGLGVQHCERCGWCNHSTVTDGICGFCGRPSPAEQGQCENDG